MNLHSVRLRFAASVLSNIIRSAASLVAGLIVARGLAPEGYGRLTFLLTSFIAVRSLLDLGTSSAFYTFTASQPQTRRFRRIYYGWLAVQFMVSVLAIGVLLPLPAIERIWLSNSRGVIVLAFTATFLQQQIWTTVNQVAESARRTVKVQLLNQVLAFVHLGLMWALMTAGLLSVPSVLWMMVGEHAMITAIAWHLLRDRIAPPAELGATGPDLGAAVRQYWTYCRPIVVLSLLTFLYGFMDRWMLQYFGGEAEQGLYQVAYQFAAISLLATTSIINIFWKEIAEAHARQDLARVAALYVRISRGLIVVSAAIGGFLMPRSELIVRMMLGPSYLMAAPALTLMFLYPVHQSMGQIGTTMMLASGYTKGYLATTIVSILIGLPITCLILAPPDGFVIRGLGLGATGMAIKMVIVNILSVNVQIYLVARHFGWRFEWLHQIAAVAVSVALGYLANGVGDLLWRTPRPEAPLTLALPLLTSGLVFASAIGALVLMVPWLVGMDRAEVKRHLFVH